MGMGARLRTSCRVAMITPVECRRHAIECRQMAARIYFPLSGMISLLAVMQTSEAIETGIIGADGLLGGDAPINGHLFANATVQLEGSALTILRQLLANAAIAASRLLSFP